MSFFPDISVYLPQLKNAGLKPVVLSSRTKPKMGVFLARSIYLKNQAYPTLINGIASALDILAKTHDIYLMAFNTFESSTTECDHFINRDVYTAMKEKQSAILDEMRYSVTEMRDVFQQLDFALTMRYHSHMYAVETGTPFVSIYTTSKVENLLIDTGLHDCGYNMPLDEALKPIGFNVDDFMATYELAKELRDANVLKMSRYVSRYADLGAFEDRLVSMMVKACDESPKKVKKSRNPM
ncbi:hypothetical protein HDU81_009391 [Chytriomyces hyalinus]|nr:hypothetical protein HDU81_009391 [Chytriomyces hyalinus]